VKVAKAQSGLPGCASPCDVGARDRLRVRAYSSVDLPALLSCNLDPFVRC
jgi:hypothetical protein